MNNRFTKVETLGNNHIRLPRWLDDLIYRDIKATHNPCGKNMVVLNWDSKDILNYLGTYFPRSFTESYCIFTKYLKYNREDYKDQSTLNIFDFGCGTGGELLGLLWAILENLTITSINIKAIDGNFHGLRILEELITRFKRDFHSGVSLNVMPLQIDDIYDMTMIAPHIPNENHIILIFKSVCEIASLRQFDEKNPYQHIIGIMLDKLNTKGIICLADVSSFNEEQQEWLPILIDTACKDNNTKICMRNDNFNEKFCVSHSGKINDSSKLSWRILRKVDI